MNRVIYILLALVGITGCYTVKDAVKQTHRAKDKYPDTIAAVLRAWKPCIVTYNDTLIKTDTLTDIIAVECPGDTLWRTDTLETSYAISVPRIIKVPLPRIRETRTINIRTKDMADVQVCEGQRDAAAKDAAANRVWKRAFMWAAIIGWLLFILSLLMRRR